MTTYAAMLELSDPPDVYVRAHGWGSARVMGMGSQNANPGFLVRLYGTGKVLWVDMTDLRWAHNPGDPRDGVDIPADWQPQARVPASEYAVPVPDTKVFAVECD